MASADEVVECDYLVIGAGAMGMAFTDELLSSDPSATIALVDRHARCGGHWNDAYTYVQLHQPAAYYGVNSVPLGHGADLASGAEVLSYFEKVRCAMPQCHRPRRPGGPARRGLISACLSDSRCCHCPGMGVLPAEDLCMLV